MEVQAAQTQLWPLAVYLSVVVLLALFMLVSSYLLGQRHMESGTGIPYESGIRPTGLSWVPFDVRYYLIAVFFVIFDVEAIFVYAWAAVLREAGWTGFVEMSIFIGMILLALFYLWRMGALDWAASSRKRSGLPRHDGRFQ
jgi:NADH-quinone oxidoreductase subunit A